MQVTDIYDREIYCGISKVIMQLNSTEYYMQVAYNILGQ